MMTTWQVILCYLAVMNVMGFFFMGLDKWKARKRAFRIPETTLLLISALGGAAGAFIGMRLFHHKTRHWYFAYGIPAMLIIHILIGLFMWKGPVQFIFF